jgi:hypothetical protein
MKKLGPSRNLLPYVCLQNGVDGGQMYDRLWHGLTFEHLQWWQILPLLTSFCHDIFENPTTKAHLFLKASAKRSEKGVKNK